MLKRTCKRTGPELRRFARLSEPCTLKRAFISPGMQKIVFWYKNLNPKHPKVPYKQFITLAWQQLTAFGHEWYKGGSLTLFHNLTSHEFSHMDKHINPR